MKASVKALCCVIAVCIGLPPLVSCDGAGRQTPPAATQPAEAGKSQWYAGDGVTLEWYVNVPQQEPGGQQPGFPDLREVAGITGVTPELTVDPSENGELLEARIAANDLPDMMTFAPASSNINRLIGLKQVYSYDELIGRFCPEFKNEIDAGIWHDLAYDDGNLYMLPSFYVPPDSVEKHPGMGMATLNVRKDIYEAMGSPDMNTPEKFAAALRLFKERYPTIGGKPSIPVCLTGLEDGQFDVMEGSFGIRVYYEDEKHELMIRFRDPKYIGLVLYVNSLYRDGLMNPAAFIDRPMQTEEELESGRVFAITADYSSLTQANEALESKRPGSQFVAIEPLQAVPGASFAGADRLGRAFTMISSKTDKPEQTIRFVRNLWSRDANLPESFGYGGEGVMKGAGELEADRKNAMAIADRYAYDWPAALRFMTPGANYTVANINNKINDIIAERFPLAVMAKSKEGAAAYFDFMMRLLEKADLHTLENYWSARYKLNLRCLGRK